MWFVVSKKRYQLALDLWRGAEVDWAKTLSTQKQYTEDLTVKVAEQSAVLQSSEREQVLNDLQDALNLIRTYQRSLSIMSAADPNIVAANALLDRYGMKPDEHATYLGFQRTIRFKEPKLDVPKAVDLSTDTDSLTTTIPPKEQSRWGDGAYGKGQVRIEAEAIDEGDSKEPGHTRAHIRFVDLDADES